jgi:hypothetical protein
MEAGTTCSSTSQGSVVLATTQRVLAIIGRSIILRAGHHHRAVSLLIVHHEHLRSFGLTHVGDRRWYASAPGGTKQEDPYSIHRDSRNMHWRIFHRLLEKLTKINLTDENVFCFPIYSVCQGIVAHACGWGRCRPWHNMYTASASTATTSHVPRALRRPVRVKDAHAPLVKAEEDLGVAHAVERWAKKVLGPTHYWWWRWLVGYDGKGYYSIAALGWHRLAKARQSISPRREMAKTYGSFQGVQDLHMWYMCT